MGGHLAGVFLRLPCNRDGDAGERAPLPEAGAGSPGRRGRPGDHAGHFLVNTNTSLSASLLKPMVPSSVVGMSARGGHRGRLVRHSVHVAISYRLSVVAEDSRRWPHPFSEVLTPTFGTQPRDECLYFGVLGLQLRGVVGAVAPRSPGPPGAPAGPASAACRRPAPARSAAGSRPDRPGPAPAARHLTHPPLRPPFRVVRAKKKCSHLLGTGIVWACHKGRTTLMRWRAMKPTVQRRSDREAYVDRRSG